MAERGDVTQETVASGLSLLLKTNRALLDKAKLEAQGRTHEKENAV